MSIYQRALAPSVEPALRRTCHQLPVIDEQTRNYQNESQARRAATSRKTA